MSFFSQSQRFTLKPPAQKKSQTRKSPTPNEPVKRSGSYYGQIKIELKPKPVKKTVAGPCEECYKETLKKIISQRQNFSSRVT
jgi:hypothetical protein